MNWSLKLGFDNYNWIEPWSWCWTFNSSFDSIDVTSVLVEFSKQYDGAEKNRFEVKNYLGETPL